MSNGHDWLRPISPRSTPEAEGRSVARAPREDRAAQPGLPAFLHSAVPATIARAPEESETAHDPAALARVRGALDAALSRLRDMAVSSTTFADWIVPLLGELAAAAGERSREGIETAGRDISIGFPGTSRRFTLRLVLDDRAEPKLHGYFTAEGRRATIGVNVQRHRDADPFVLSRTLYHEFIHLFVHWFRDETFGGRLPPVTPAVKGRLGLTSYRWAIDAVAPQVRTIAAAIATLRGSSAPGDPREIARSLVEETVVAAETAFMDRVSLGVARGLGEVTSLEIDDETAASVGRGVGDYLFESGLMFASSDQRVLESNPGAAEAEQAIRRTLAAVSVDYLTLRAGTERAIRAR